MSDEVLIRRILDGEPKSIRRVQGWIRRVTSQFGSALGIEAEDVEQAILVDLVSSLRAERFRGGSSLRTYVQRAARYKCIDRIRAKGRREWVELEETELVDDLPNPDEAASSRDQSRLLLEVLNEMPAGCRELWRLLADGATYAEAGRQLDVREATLRVRALRCRKKAAEALHRARQEAAEGLRGGSSSLLSAPD